MRITMGMIAGQYKTRLNQSLQALSAANIRATNYRSFNKPSDDPFAAAQTFQIRRETQLNANYQSNLSNVQSSLKTAENAVRLVSDIVSDAGSTDALGAINGAMTKDTRSAVIKKLDSMRNAIVSDMNAKYSDQYLFGGAGAGSPPFSIGEDGSLLYRGINVDTGVNTNGASATVSNNSSTQIDFGSANAAGLKGYSIVVKTGSPDGVNVSGTTISVSLTSGSTKGDLQNTLQNNLAAALTAAGKSTSGMDFSKITVTGTPTDAATVSKGGAATQISDDGKSTVMNNSTMQINFGKENAGLLNAYKIQITTGGTGQVTVSGDTITADLSAGATKGDLQNTIRNNLAAALTAAGKSTDDMDFSKITVAGNKDDAATVSQTGDSSQISNKVNLDDLAHESVYVDLGFGLQFDDSGNVVPQSAYDSSLPGIQFLGYGTNDQGIPNNVYSLMGKISDLLNSDNVSMDTIQPYLDSFKDATNNLTTQTTEIGAKELFLNSTQTHLEDTSSNLLTKDNNVEFVEPSDAIMDWMTQQFCYQACLQMGTNILQPTLMDFLK